MQTWLISHFKGGGGCSLLWGIFSLGLVLISDMQLELLLRSGLLHNLV